MSDSPYREPEARGWVSDAAAAICVALATFAVTVGAYYLAREGHASPRNAVLAALLTTTAWCMLAAPMAAAAGRSAWSALLRGGIVADASFLALAALWLWARGDDGHRLLTFLAVLEIYATLLALALAATAVVLCAGSPAGRYGLAAAAAVVGILLLAGPLWIGGILQQTQAPTAQTVAAWCVKANPFYAIASAAPALEFVWHQSPWMYRLTDLGDYAAPPAVNWYSSAWRYGLLAVGLALVAMARNARRKAQVQLPLRQ